MPVRHRSFKSLPVALLSLSATFALSITLLGCGVSSTANEWSWVSGSNTLDASSLYAAAGNVREARYNWTESSSNSSSAPAYASSAPKQLNRFWEFSPTTELWSWAGSSTQDDLYVAAMPELTTPTDNAWTWVNGSKAVDESGAYSLAATGNVSGAPFSWTDSSENSSGGQEFASNATSQPNHFWEFSSTTERWSWASGSSTEDKTYLAAMPELTTPTDNAWTWVNGSNTLGEGASYGTPTLAAATKVPGARCVSVNWIESATAPSRCIGDELQASLNDYWRYGP